MQDAGDFLVPNEAPADDPRQDRIQEAWEQNMTQRLTPVVPMRQQPFQECPDNQSSSWFGVQRHIDEPPSMSRRPAPNLWDSRQAPPNQDEWKEVFQDHAHHLRGHDRPGEDAWARTIERREKEYNKWLSKQPPDIPNITHAMWQTFPHEHRDFIIEAYDR